MTKASVASASPAAVATTTEERHQQLRHHHIKKTKINGNSKFDKKHKDDNIS